MHHRRLTLKTRLAGLELSSPVMVASGTFGYGEEFKDFFPLEAVGAIVTKTITLQPRKGCPPGRLCETASGLINAIGLENVGLDKFLKEKSPFLQSLGIPVIVSIMGKTVEEFANLAALLAERKAADALELNISCPNVKNSKFEIRNSKLIAQDSQATYEVVKAVRRAVKLPLITKLSPNVTDITKIARAAEKAGTDALALVNTFLAMAIDINSRQPYLGAVTGGLSGPAIRPIAVRMVWEVYNAVRCPIIGMGGIIEAKDALEFIIAGARAVAVGTANFIDPRASLTVLKGIKGYMRQHGYRSLAPLVGSLNVSRPFGGRRYLHSPKGRDQFGQMIYVALRAP